MNLSENVVQDTVRTGGVIYGRGRNSQNIGKSEFTIVLQLSLVIHQGIAF